ncbi:MAG: hypothetical protein Ct9H300mP1_05170 [Planctomycetaceae bacterium]|nr:MAG: hypothetical protein Ct9H300mP1_05170 [Planctomycetaceae bacterium]
MLYLHRYSFALIKPFLKEEFGCQQHRTRIHGCRVWGDLFRSTVSDRVVGRRGRVHWLRGGLILLWSVSLAMHAWAPNAKILYAARALLGAGQAGVFSLVGRLTRRGFP